MSTGQELSSHDLLDVLADADVLKTFNRLPVKDQENFARWIGIARDDVAYWRRIDALVLSLRLGPLQPRGSRGLPWSGTDSRSVEAAKEALMAPVGDPIAEARVGFLHARNGRMQIEHV